MPLRHRNVVIIIDNECLLQVLQVNCASTQEVSTIGDEAFISVHDVKDDRGSVRELVVVHEVKRYFLALHKDRIQVVFNDRGSHIIASCIEDRYERIRAAITVSSWQVSTLEDIAAQVVRADSLGRWLLPS